MDKARGYRDAAGDVGVGADFEFDVVSGRKNR